MKITGLLLVLNAMTLCLQSQEIKTYDGNFKGGNATFGYYENENYNRIYHGGFSYIRLTPTMVKGKVRTSKLTIQGSFNNGNKVGKWVQLNDVVDENKNVLNQTKVIGNYLDGLPTGLWKIEYFNLKTDANTISEFEFDSTGSLKRIKADKIEGQFNVDGKFHGKWRGIYWNSQGEKLERIYDFHNGVVAKCITRY